MHDGLAETNSLCNCGRTVYILSRRDQPDCIICLDCGNGMLKTSHDQNIGGWIVGFIDNPTMLRLRDVAKRPVNNPKK